MMILSLPLQQYSLFLDKKVTTQQLSNNYKYLHNINYVPGQTQGCCVGRTWRGPMAVVSCVAVEKAGVPRGKQRPSEPKAQTT